MKGVCFENVSPYDDYMMSGRSDGRDVDVCKTLMPNGEGCAKRDFGEASREERGVSATSNV